MPLAKPVEYVVDTNGCHLCTSHLSKTFEGYPRLFRVIGGRRMMIRLSRFIYEKSKGPIPPGMLVRHSCDNPPCINPEHLLLGTSQDNVRDCIERGRNAVGVRNGSAKLTPELVRVIRAERATKGTTYKELGDRYGLHGDAIRQLVVKKTWKHVT